MENATALPPVLVTVTTCVGLLVPTAWLANVRLEGESWTAGPAPAPFPINATLAVPPKLSEARVSEPATRAEDAGGKVTCTAEDAPDASEAGQLFELTAKSPLALAVPEESVATLAFETVKVSGELVVPTL